MSLTEKVPELTNKYSIRLQFPTMPFTMCEVPGIMLLLLCVPISFIFLALPDVINDYNSLISEDMNGYLSTKSSEDSSLEEEDKNYTIFPTKVQSNNLY